MPNQQPNLEEQINNMSTQNAMDQNLGLAIQKPKFWLTIIAIILITVMIGAGAYWWQKIKWQTYQSEKWGYEIKYPSGWAQWYSDFSRPENTSDFGLNKELQRERSLRNGEIRVDVIVGIYDSFEKMIEEKGLQYREPEEMIINGIKAIKTTWKLGETPSYVVYIYNPDQKLEYSIECFKCPSDKSINDTFNKMISTFKFIISGDQTANWQTYLNDKYGFETKYPVNYNMRIDNDETGLLTVRFINQRGLSYYNINVTENNKSPNLSNFISNPECYEQIREDRHNDMDWTISWWKCSSGGDKNPIAAYTAKGNYIFEVLLDSDSQDLSIEKIDQILTTFKFVNETANWQTYRNEELGISFLYPKFWGEVKEYRIKGPSEEMGFFGERVVSGTQVVLSFSVNDFLLLFFNSPDYKTVISTTKGEEAPSEFTGKEEQLICEPFFLGISQVTECNQISIAGSPAVEWYLGDQWVQACGYGLWKNLKIISPNKNFPGLSIRTAVLGADYQTECDEEKTKFKPDISLEEFINLRISQLNENQLPFGSKQYLFELDNFIKSIKFIK